MPETTKIPVLDLRGKAIVRPKVRLDSGEYQMLAYQELRASSFHKIAQLHESLESGELSNVAKMDALLKGVHSVCIDMPTEVAEKLSVEDLSEIFAWWVANAGFPSPSEEADNAEVNNG